MTDNTIEATVSGETYQYLQEWADAVGAPLDAVAGDAIEQFFRDGAFIYGDDAKGTVRLEDTSVVADDGTVDMASLSKSGCKIDE